MAFLGYLQITRYRKNLSEKQLQALPMYDSEEIYVCRDHLNNFDSANLLDIAEDIDENTVATWLKEASKVEVF